MHRWSRATTILRPATMVSVEPRMEGSAMRWIGVGVVNPRWRSALRSAAGRPSAWNEPPPESPLVCLRSLRPLTTAWPSARLRDRASDGSEANRASSSASESSSGTPNTECWGLPRLALVFVGFLVEVDVDGPSRSAVISKSESESDICDPTECEWPITNSRQTKS